MSIALNATFLKQPTGNVPGILGVRILPSANTAQTAKVTEVAFVIDTSGSMEGERIDSVRQTLKVVAQTLKQGDKLTLVGFAQTATTILSQFTLANTSTDSLAPAMKAIDELRAGGGTNLGAGICALGAIYKDVPKPDAIVVLTDGYINEGVVSFSGLKSILDTYFKNIPTYTLGYGTAHNAELLKQIAENSCANYTFIKSELSLPITMGDLYGGLRSEVATKAVLNYPETWACLEKLSDNNASFTLGSLIVNKAMWVMFSVPFGTEADVVLSYNSGNVTCSVNAPIDTTLPPVSVEEQYLRCVNAKVLDKVAEFIKAGRLNDAVSALNDTIKMIEESNVATNEFVVCMKAQLAETLEKTQVLLRSPPRVNRQNNMDDLYYRTTSIGGNFASQRGRTQMAGGATPMLFSTQQQGDTSVVMADCYSHGGCAVGNDPVSPRSTGCSSADSADSP